VVAFQWPLAVLGWLSFLSLVVFLIYAALTAKPRPRNIPRLGAGD